MYQNKSIEIVRLYPHDTTLVGRYAEGVGAVVVELHSDVRSFIVYLPSLFSCYQTQFFFKNFGANAVTIMTVNSEIIDYSAIVSRALAYKEFLSLLSNNIDKWISLESNTGAVWA